MQKITTADGSTVEITRVGLRYDVHVRNASGATIATVDMNTEDLLRLIESAERAL